MTIFWTLGTRFDSANEIPGVKYLYKKAVKTEEPKDKKRHQNDDKYILMVYLLMTWNIFDALMKL